MRYYLLLIILSLTGLSVNAQADFIEWQRVLGGAGDEEAYDLIATNDGGLLLVGYTTSSMLDSGDVQHTNHGGKDFWIVKLDNSPFPNIEWEKNYGTSKEDVALKALQDEDNGHYIVIGKTGKIVNSNSVDTANNYSYWMMELNANGEMIRDTLFGTKYVDNYHDSLRWHYFSKIKLLRSKKNKEHLIFLGDISTVEQTIFYHLDIWWLKMDWTTWEVIEDKHFDYDGPDDRRYDSLAKGLIELQNGDFVFCADLGTDIDPTIMKKYEFWVQRIAPNGNFGIKSYFGGSGDEVPCDMIIDNDDNLLVIGYSSSLDGDVEKGYWEWDNNYLSDDIWVLKIDTLFQKIWSKVYGGDYIDIGRSIIQSADGGYFLGGHAGSQSFTGEICSRGNGHWFLIKITKDGDLQWTRTLGSGGGETIYSMAERNNKLVAAGFVEPGTGDVDLNQFHAGRDIWVVQFKDPDCDALPKPLLKKTIENDSVRFEVTNTPNTQGVMLYRWSSLPEDTSTSQSLIILPFTDTNKYVVRFNLDCCFSAQSDTFSVNVVLPPIDTFVFHRYIALTPNGDGKNEVLFFEGLHEKNVLTVYNRWGEKVFERQPYQNDWGGTWKGALLPEADYFFRLKFPDENKTYTGYVRISY